jgi:orotate phosphoribosyltransferase
MSLENKLKYLQQEIEHKAIYRVKPNEKQLPAKAPNFSYTWQMYLRRCLFDPKFLFVASELLVNLLPNKDVQIAACEDAGVTLGLAMSAYLNTPMISIKKSRKAYGLLNFTEGTITGKPLVLVDDLAGSQDTLKKAESILKAFKLPVAEEYVALINKTKGTHPEAYLRDKKLISLFNCDDFCLSFEDYIRKYKKIPEFGKFF